MTLLANTALSRPCAARRARARRRASTLPAAARWRASPPSTGTTAKPRRPPPFRTTGRCVCGAGRSCCVPIHHSLWAPLVRLLTAQRYIRHTAVCRFLHESDSASARWGCRWRRSCGLSARSLSKFEVAGWLGWDLHAGHFQAVLCESDFNSSCSRCAALRSDSCHTSRLFLLLHIRPQNPCRCRCYQSRRARIVRCGEGGSKVIGGLDMPTRAQIRWTTCRARWIL